MIEKFTTKVSINTKGEALSEQEVMDNRSSAYDFIDVDKQETLEEAAEKYIKEYDVENYISIEDFIIGAKWQKERSYSEEEVLDMLNNLRLDSYNYGMGRIEFLEWFNKFKKK